MSSPAGPATLAPNPQRSDRAFTEAAKQRLRGLHQVRLLVRLKLTDQAGNQTVVSRRRTLHR
jgi:hypothetical protein